jgi:preprotein translocase subunit SecG
MTEAMEIYEACMSIVAAKAEVVQARKTWLLVIVILAATICICILILFLLHRRNKRKNHKKKLNINNNTDQKGLSPPEEQEISSDELLKEAKS